MTLTLLAGMSGCVSLQDYEGVKSDLAKARSELTDSRGQVEDLRVALADAQTDVELLSARISDLEQLIMIAEERKGPGQEPADRDRAELSDLPGAREVEKMFE
ncbi:hypothetical protein [Enhygromyxa salina]|uniref:Uncharacterized protein n=1 Tax=Enhygromyxa salina TaxID=215803 RepID=A0A2S9XSI1_9BACT|nr:hypothetical protein [Enhygromyxa salina]PRP95700.1 hypothetical protein ENSA7_73340 [Enhygromyxa salina]